MEGLAERAGAIIIGGGIVGASIAYHLTKRGLTDIVVVEQHRLTAGTTWHAAGLVGELRGSANLTDLGRYTTRLYEDLEAETGLATGFRRCGALSLATTTERWIELRRNASIARGFGLRAELIGAAEAQAKWPLIDVSDVLGALFLPDDGVTNPVDTTMALAKGAKQAGARIVEGERVERLIVEGGRIVGVAGSFGELRAPVVVLAAGLWSRELAATVGVTLPLHAAEHFYVVTEPMAGLDSSLPILRDPDRCAYFKEDAGKLLVGWFEPVAKPWGHHGIPRDFAFGTLPQDIDHIESLLCQSIKRLPQLGETGIRTFFNGPESFTPDDRYYLGETPEVRGLFVAAGFNSIGIQSAGSAGKALADWIVDGAPPCDLAEVDIRRANAFQTAPRYLHDRTRETLGLLYAMHWPQRQVATARGVRRSPLHSELLARGACFGVVAGWERANWFAPGNAIPTENYAYDYGGQNAFASTATEHHAVRNGVALFDQSSFAKFRVVGPDAAAALDRLSANSVDVLPGRIVYTQWLNERGGIEADLTITRLSEYEFLIVTAAASSRRDFAWLKRGLEGSRSIVVDVTSGLATLSIMGPQSRALLRDLTSVDVSNAAQPFATSREIDIGYAWVRASRITYVGELGWELYVPTECAAHVYEHIIMAGAAHGLVHAGYYALDSCRMEKGYRHWGHDLSDEDTPLEAGLGFAIAWDKSGGFVGRDVLLRHQATGRRPKRLVTFALERKIAVYQNEPIFASGQQVGRVTSGAYGHCLGHPIALGYVHHAEGVTAEWLSEQRFEIEIANERVVARPSLKPLYDPYSTRIRC